MAAPALDSIKAGDVYRTRDGREARIYATDGGGDYPIHGATRWPGERVWEDATWTARGLYFPQNGDCGRDLILPTALNRRVFEGERGRDVTVFTSFERKPGPTDRFDWSAVTSNYEPGAPIGYGRTEREAIDALLDQLDDADVAATEKALTHGA